MAKEEGGITTAEADRCTSIKGSQDITQLSDIEGQDIHNRITILHHWSKEHVNKHRIVQNKTSNLMYLAVLISPSSFILNHNKLAQA